MEGPPKAPLHPTSSGMDVIFVPSTEALGSAQESRQKGNNRETKRSHGKPSGPSKTCSVSKKPGPGAGEKLDEALVGGVGQARASARMPPGPRAILLTPRCDGPKEKTTVSLDFSLVLSPAVGSCGKRRWRVLLILSPLLQKEAGHVTFVSDPEERLIPAGDWSVRPFLGYDWIAGKGARLLSSQEKVPVRTPCASTVYLQRLALSPKQAFFFHASFLGWRGGAS